MAGEKQNVGFMRLLYHVVLEILNFKKSYRIQDVRTVYRSRVDLSIQLNNNY